MTAPTTQQARKAVERGLDFVVKDAVKWRTEENYATCHHGTMTVWTLGGQEKETELRPLFLSGSSPSTPCVRSG